MESSIKKTSAEHVTSKENKETSPLSPEDNQKGNIVFYCKNCKEIVAAQKIGKKYEYKCPNCHEKDIAFGTERSIKNVYKL